MPRGQRIFVAALFLSLAAHLFAVGNASRWWTPPVHEHPVPIEARLNLLVEPASAPVSPSTPASSQARKVHRIKPQSASEKLVPPSSQPERDSVSEPAMFSPSATLPPAAQAEPLAQLAEPVTVPVPQSFPQPAAVPAPAAPSPRGLRNLPERIALRYSVQSGEDGFVLGQTSYSGQIRNGHYSLASVTEATGIATLFISGKIIQTSEGQITANGMQPALFWSVQGKRKPPPVRFDWPQHRLMLPTGGVELPPQTQDLLSFPFHLAMTVREDDAAWTLPVTNGRKLLEYAFQIVGWETLDSGAARIETLRVQGSRSGEGSLDVWLAPGRNGLPVRIRMLDHKNKVIVLTLQDAPS